MKHLTFALTILAFAASASATDKAPPVKPTKNPITVQTPLAAASAYVAPISVDSSASMGNVSPSAQASGGSAGYYAERSAPGIAVGAPSQPISSCRLGFSGGGSNSGGALGFGLVLGNDMTCLVGARIEAMKRVGGFSQEEFQQVACEIEGMAKLETCKRVTSGASAPAPVSYSTRDPYNQ